MNDANRLHRKADKARKKADQAARRVYELGLSPDLGREVEIDADGHHREAPLRFGGADRHNGVWK
jgi:hypothetical protein